MKKIIFGIALVAAMVLGTTVNAQTPVKKEVKKEQTATCKKEGKANKTAKACCTKKADKAAPATPAPKASKKK